MPVEIDLKDLEPLLRDAYGENLAKIAKEALLIEAYRAGKISVGRLAQTIGMTSIEAGEWLAAHGVGPNYSVSNFKDDIETVKSRLAE